MDLIWLVVVSCHIVAHGLCSLLRSVEIASKTHLLLLGNKSGVLLEVLSEMKHLN